MYELGLFFLMPAGRCRILLGTWLPSFLAAAIDDDVLPWGNRALGDHAVFGVEGNCTWVRCSSVTSFEGVFPTAKQFGSESKNCCCSELGCILQHLQFNLNVCKTPYQGEEFV